MLDFTIALSEPRLLVFFGNHFFSTDYLLEQLQVFGSALNVLPPSLCIQELLSLYHRYGFCQAHITTQKNKDQELILITEGARVVIKEIKFVGVTFFDPQRLIIDYMAKIYQSQNFKTELLEKALHALILAYQDQGFWDARIIKHDLTPLPDGGNLLEIQIDEGVQYTIGQVTLDAPCADLATQSPFTHREPIPCQLSQLALQQKAIERYASEHNLSLQNVKPILTRQNKQVDIHWEISLKGTGARFGKTIIADCPQFPHHYLLRELTYKQGDIFDPHQLKRSLLRLRDLDIFETIHLTPLADAISGERPIILRVHKDDPYELRLRLGLGLQQMSTEFTFRAATYSAGGVFKIKNPFNKADQMRVEVDYKRGMHSAAIIYQRPWILDLPITMNLNGYTTKYLQPGWIEIQHNLYAISQQGFTLGFMYNQQLLSAEFNVGFEWMETQTTSVPDDRYFNLALARALNFVPELLDHHVPYFLLAPTLVIDATDNKVNPTRGSFTLLTLKSMIPLAFGEVASYFVKMFLQQSVYIPLQRCQLMIGLRVGHIFQKNLTSIMPSERFYLGGANSIRSYQTDSCPPLGLFINQWGEKVFVPQGSRSLINGNVEFRFPVSERIMGAVFQDLGALSNTAFTQIKRKDILAGTGFGARYTTPIGPLRFDIAWKWRREDRSISPLAWYITFGSVF